MHDSKFLVMRYVQSKDNLFFSWFSYTAHLRTMQEQRRRIRDYWRNLFLANEFLTILAIYKIRSLTLPQAADPLNNHNDNTQTNKYHRYNNYSHLRVWNVLHNMTCLLHHCTTSIMYRWSRKDIRTTCYIEDCWRDWWNCCKVIGGRTVCVVGW